MKQKAITAVALAASFSAGYISAPPLPHSVNPSIIKLGEENQAAVDRYRGGVRTAKTNECGGKEPCGCEPKASLLDRAQTTRIIPNGR